VDAGYLALGVERFDFARKAGRPAGVEEPTAFLRKGIAGDWQSRFSREAGEVFDHHAGLTLIEAGYEPDRSWVATCDA